MTSAAALPLPRRSKGCQPCFGGGLCSGAWDIRAAFIVCGWFGLNPILLLQGIPGGLLEARAGRVDWQPPPWVCFSHSSSLFSGTAVYYAASRRLPFRLRKHSFRALHWEWLRSQKTSFPFRNDGNWMDERHLLCRPADRGSDAAVRVVRPRCVHSTS